MSRATKPMPLTINSTSVADTAPGAYAPATTYDLGDLVSATDATGKTTLTHEYKSLQAANTGQSLTDTTWWQDRGATNHHKMFDASTSTLTTDTETITVDVSPGEFFDVVGLARLDNVTDVEITIERGGVELFNETLSLYEDVSDHWEYHFAPIESFKTKLEWREEVWYSDCNIVITLTGPSGETIGCGTLMVGRSIDLGDALYGATVGIDDYSTKETDPDLGYTYLLEREFADTAEVSIVMDRRQTGWLKKKLATLRATPALYNLNNSDSEDEQDDSLIIFGKYDAFSINFESAAKSYCSLTLVELIEVVT